MDESRDSLERLTTAQAAARLGISEAGVRKRVQRKQMPHRQLRWFSRLRNRLRVAGASLPEGQNTRPGS